MLSYFKKYRKWKGGKWYKVIIYNPMRNLFTPPYHYYTQKKPSKVNHWVIKKYRYGS